MRIKLSPVKSFLFGLGLMSCLAHAHVPNPAEHFTLCLDADNAPFSSSRSADGIDVEIAKALASFAERHVEFVWVSVPNRGGLGKALKDNVQTGHCDAYMGVPAGEESDEAYGKRGLSPSRPYLRLGYVWIVRADAKPMSVSGLRGAQTVGAVTATPADLYLHKEGYKHKPYNSGSEILEALTKGEIGAALVWSSTLAGMTGQSNLFKVLPDQPRVAELETPLLIVARTQAPGNLVKTLSETLEEMDRRGILESIAERRGLPWLAIDAKP